MGVSCAAVAIPFAAAAAAFAAAAFAAAAFAAAAFAAAVAGVCTPQVLEFSHDLGFRFPASFERIWELVGGPYQRGFLGAPDLEALLAAKAAHDKQEQQQQQQQQQQQVLEKQEQSRL